ncbi:MAG: hypothetical protein ABH845_04760 [Candidatus Omnitrophota bacterium]
MKRIEKQDEAKRRATPNGFTLLEVVISSAILLLTILGVLATYQHAIVLSRVNEGHTLALQSAQATLEKMRGHVFGRLLMDYGPSGNPGNTFVPAGLTGRGAISFDTTDPAVLGVRIVVCWREKGRLFGEDENLNGRLDSGEDANGNGLLDSPVRLVTFLTQEAPP